MTAFKWNNEVYSGYRDRYGILSTSLDLYVFELVLDTLPEVTDILELGTYIGGALIFFNDILKKNQVNTRFTAVDDLSWTKDIPEFPWNNHMRRHVSRDSFASLEKIKTADDAAQWLKERCKALSSQDIDIRWMRSEDHLDDRKYSVIFHDYGQTKEENTTTINNCLPKLHNNGIYVIDDFETAQPYRIIATIEAMQQGKLFPVVWGSKKVFFANNVEFAKTFIDRLKNNPNFDNKAFAPYADYTVSGTTYNPIRLLLSPLK
jgi:hypothetical protein